ncbi:MAG: nodulation protein NfeD [Chromatiaceae bacterium]
MTAPNRADLLPVLALCLWSLLCGEALARGEALLIPVDGSIGVATGELVERGLARAAEQGVELVILRLDTPGGLDTAMRRIIKAILASQIPVAAYVAPSGARAASAGTYILYAAHIAAMAPATNLGAATPVQVGGAFPGIGEPETPEGTKGEAAGAKDAMERKLVNDAVAYIRGLATLRGRNADWAEQAVRESVSLNAQAALDAGVIDLVAPNVRSLLQGIDGRSVDLPGGPRTLATDGLPVRELEPGWRARLLAVITDPNVAYVLLIIGIYGILFELANPGAVLPGVIGGISLILALYALQLLPVNYAGLALILFGVAFMAAEAFVPSFGALGLGGLVAFLAGSVILMDERGMPISPAVIASTGLASGAFFIWVLSRLVRLRRRAPVVGTEHLIGAIGETLDDFGTGDQRSGRVRVAGEIWSASADSPLHRGQRVRVLSVTGLHLSVTPEHEE